VTDRMNPPAPQAKASAKTAFECHAAIGAVDGTLGPILPEVTANRGQCWQEGTGRHRQWARRCLAGDQRAVERADFQALEPDDGFDREHDIANMGAIDGIVDAVRDSGRNGQMILDDRDLRIQFLIGAAILGECDGWADDQFFARRSRLVIDNAGWCGKGIIQRGKANPHCGTGAGAQRDKGDLIKINPVEPRVSSLERRKAANVIFIVDAGCFQTNTAAKSIIGTGDGIFRCALGMGRGSHKQSDPAQRKDSAGYHKKGGIQKITDRQLSLADAPHMGQSLKIFAACAMDDATGLEGRGDIMSESYTGKAVIVTGAGRGIGAGIAKAFAAAGANVMLAVRTLSYAEETKAQIAAAGGSAEIFQIDVKDHDACTALIEATAKRFDGVDVIIHCAADIPHGGVGHVSDEALESGFASTAKAAWWLLDAARPHLAKARDGGRFIAIGSVNGTFTVVPNMTAYGMAKAALDAFVRGAAGDVVADGITVNAVNPGLVASARALAVLGDEGLAAYGATVPVGRAGTPEDIAHACLFLASARSGYITGTSIKMDGGSTVAAASGRNDILQEKLKRQSEMRS
jgi:3-oxoacyl-[acyl-carrier protein] reductase